MDVFSEVFARSRSFFRAAAVSAAVELGLFDALASSPPDSDPASLALRLGVSVARLSRLLDVLRLEGLLPLGAPPDAGPVPHEGWGRLAEVLRSDRPLPLSPADSSAYHAHLRDVGAPIARELVARVVPSSARRVLDAGGGAGAYTSAALAADPLRSVTLVDRPEVLALARGALAAFGDRVEYVADDLLSMSLPEDYDAALLVNVLHLHGPAAARRIISAIVAALRPGGRLVVKDLAIVEDRSGPPAAVYFALNMALYTAHGDVWPASVVDSWLREAGLVGLRHEHLDSAPSAAVTIAHKP